MNFGTLTFINFEANSASLKSFIEKNKKTIFELIDKCFYVNPIEKKEMNSYINPFKKLDCFFLLDMNRVVAMGNINTNSVYKTNLKISQYIDEFYFLQGEKGTMQELFKEGTEDIRIYPVIESVCRSNKPKYKGLGRYFLNLILKFLKNKKHDKAYLVVGSSKHERTTDEHWFWDCSIDDDKEFINDQKKLQKYYENFGFRLVQDLHYFVHCDTWTYPLRVMSYDLKK